MRVLILGGGTVGASIAEFLCKKNHQVTVVDSNPAVIHGLDSELDVGVVTGSASLSSVLFQAGVTTADLCLALTGVDEVNMVASSMAKAMGATRVAARVYAKVLRDLSTFDYGDHFHIDRLLSIEHLTAMELARRIREPGAMTIEYFAHGDLELHEVAITRESASTGVPLAELKLPPEVRIGSIHRDNAITIAAADDEIRVGDRVTILGARADVEEVKKRFNTASAVKKSVAIAGGGETGFHLAQTLANRNYLVKLIESDRDRCDWLATQFDAKTSIICGDARRQKMLEEERIGASDFFVAATGDDENNILACFEAKSLGADNALAVINSPDYAGVIGKLRISVENNDGSAQPSSGLKIDHTVSPREVIERQIEGLLHTGPLVFDDPYLLGGKISVVELEVGPNSRVTREPLLNCQLPKRSLIASVVRDRFVQVPGGQFQMKAGDLVVALVYEDDIPTLVEAFAQE